MSEFESKLKEENENYKKLFNFKGSETQMKYFKKTLTNFIKNSKNNGPNYIILLLNFYSKCRPCHHRVSKELVECVLSCFPEQFDEIQQYIKENTDILKFIIFPEEFPIKETKEQKEMFLLLQKDDVDGFISFLSKNPTIDITKEQELEDDGFYYYLSDYYHISLIDFCCFFGSLKCFKITH